MNGQRIELGEIEQVLREQVDSIEDTVVTILKSPAGIDQLVAYVVPEDVKPSTVTKSCDATLPEYMIPSLVVPCVAW